MSGEPESYAWGTAPAHLRTRRQLQAEGLSPAGQGVAATVPHRWHGREQQAFLYDARKAVPKRPVSAAQREALAAATRERQLRAAERRGISRAELENEADWDPGPGWNTAAAAPEGEDKWSAALAEPTPTPAPVVKKSALAAHRGRNALARRSHERDGFDR
ncbi:RRQRL motif-containing zinc-binding protein [Nocardia harenae]|uniref:RRQRL motif-containing zinc-binding protein n=1 Tax=Nocardia harenae TaxID=358707 RepID=UPI000B09DA1D|nr:RRQRL motif-containing zinc-binding protein [Nocardia harenae]